jgi:hypothetical protein
MTTLDFYSLRDEICEDMRNADIFTIGVRGVTTQIDTFTATNLQTAFQLTKTGVKNIRSVVVNSVNKKYITDYTYVGSTGVVTLVTGATAGWTVVITYDYSTTGDRIYPDMPRNVLSLTSFPRIGIEIVSLTTEPLGLGGANHINDALVSIYVWMPANKDSSVSSGLGGTENLTDAITSIRSRIRSQAKNYQTFKWITPKSTSPIIKGENDKLIQMSADFMIRFMIE